MHALSPNWKRNKVDKSVNYSEVTQEQNKGRKSLPVLLNRDYRSLRVKMGADFKCPSFLPCTSSSTAMLSY